MRYPTEQEVLDSWKIKEYKCARCHASYSPTQPYQVCCDECVIPYNRHMLHVQKDAYLTQELAQATKPRFPS